MFSFLSTWVGGRGYNVIAPQDFILRKKLEVLIRF